MVCTFMKKWLVFLLGYICLPVITYADKPVYGAAALAGNVLEPVSVVAGFLNTTCFVVGGSFMFASLVKYVEHRRCPLLVPISTVVFLLLAGLVLIALPFVARTAGVGV